VSIDQGAYAAVTGAISFLRTESSKHYYTLAFNAADRPSAEGVARYKLDDGTYTRYFNLRVAGASTDAEGIRSAIGMDAADLDDQLDAIASAAGDATLAKQEEILSDIAGLTGVALSAATWTAGSITGFPATLVVGDSYVGDVGRALRIYYRDSEGSPIATIGSKAMTDADFAATLVISQDNQSARVKGTCTWVDPEDASEDYLQVEFPHSETRRASAGTATLQLKFTWDGGIEVEVARQSLVWTPNV